MKNLNELELYSISGGTQKNYDEGHSFGSHLRAGLKTVGDVISWAADLLPF